MHLVVTSVPQHGVLGPLEVGSLPRVQQPPQTQCQRLQLHPHASPAMSSVPVRHCMWSSASSTRTAVLLHTPSVSSSAQGLQCCAKADSTRSWLGSAVLSPTRRHLPAEANSRWAVDDLRVEGSRANCLNRKKITVNPVSASCSRCEATDACTSRHQNSLGRKSPDRPCKSLCSSNHSQ